MRPCCCCSESGNVGWLFKPLILIFGIWCGHEEGVHVQVEFAGRPVRSKVNIVCENPDWRVPVQRKDR
jgi:hypothetical protein